MRSRRAVSSDARCPNAGSCLAIRVEPLPLIYWRGVVLIIPALNADPRWEVVVGVSQIYLSTNLLLMFTTLVDRSCRATTILVNNGRKLVDAIAMARPHFVWRTPPIQYVALIDSFEQSFGWLSVICACMR